MSNPPNQSQSVNSTKYTEVDEIIYILVEKVCNSLSQDEPITKSMESLVEAKQAINTYISKVCKEVIGDDEPTDAGMNGVIPLTDDKAQLRNELRTAQRQRLNQLLEGDK